MLSEKYAERIAAHWPKEQKPVLSKEKIEYYRSEIKTLLKKQDAVIIAHFYVDSEIQKLAEETGGTVADSLAMAKFGTEHPAKRLMVAGVGFMGETAKILSPEKRVFMPTLDSTCSLDLSCQPDEFSEFCALHPDRTVVVYANTSVAVKALADWVVTSSCALDIVSKLKHAGEKLIWAPDRLLGGWIQRETGADMLIWDGACIVHAEFNTQEIEKLMEQNPDAALLAHPESPEEVLAIADVVGSTSQLLNATKNLPYLTFIVATDNGIFHKMREASPDKTFIPALSRGVGATCRSCAACPWMEMNNLKNLYESLLEEKNEIIVDEEIRERALIALNRMVKFK